MKQPDPAPFPSSAVSDDEPVLAERVSNAAWGGFPRRARPRKRVVRIPGVAGVLTVLPGPQPEAGAGPEAGAEP